MPIPATSSSARYKAAREALASRDADAMATALRALIEPSAVEETVSEIAERVLQREGGTDIRNIVAQAVHAGIQAAWESWEPDAYAEVYS